jgi:hypothetical protein
LSLYKFERTIVQITAENSGSDIEASTKSSFETGNQINTGSLNQVLAKFVNHFIFEAHQTQIAHSGSIPSLQIFFSSSLTKKNISSYLAVTIFDKYSLLTSQISSVQSSLKSKLESLKSSLFSKSSSAYSSFTFSAITVEVLSQRAISFVTLSQPRGITAE